MSTDARVGISSITFQHFKAFERYSVSLEHINILTGPNNSGKSTVIGSLRALAVGLRTARSHAPERIKVGDHSLLGYHLNENLLPISLENVATDYEEGDSRVTFRLTNGNRLTLLFENGGCIFVPEADSTIITSAALFKRHFPVTLAVVPVLGPVEHREELRARETVSASLTTHRASRHFRNYWYHFPEGFLDFADLIAKTWPGMQIHAPERVKGGGPPELSMFVREARLDRELYWVGFGFQIWCQLLTHLSRAGNSSLIVIDEPEVYLHPDIQRQLLGVMRAVGPDVLVATHSTEIIAEADPGELLLIDKQKASAERLKDIDDVQRAMHVLGSQQNITLTALARHRRVLFVEGDSDFKLMKRFAKRLGLDELAVGQGIAVMPSGGFGSWRRITVLADGVSKALGTGLMIAAVYDRDYFCDEQVEEMTEALKKSLRFAHVNARKEIENYLLVPETLDRALAKALAERKARGSEVPDKIVASASLLMELTEDMYSDVISQTTTKRCEYLKRGGRDPADVMKETMQVLAKQWATISGRLGLASGKEVLRRFRERIHLLYGVSLSDARIIDSMHLTEIDTDLKLMLRGIEEFRVAPTSQT